VRAPRDGDRTAALKDNSTTDLRSIDRGTYFDCSALDRSSACSAKRSYSFATLNTTCLACSFLRRSASSRFSLARSRQCPGSLTKEAGTFLERTANPGRSNGSLPSCAAHGVQEQISCGHSSADLGRHGAINPAGRARECKGGARYSGPRAGRSTRSLPQGIANRQPNQIRR
jgi:hypothetical protein